MIPRDCKRLAEVDFPIAIVSRHAAREKSIRHGHPSTLHLWWARRPLASSRAMLLALLLPDPCDPLCPEVFKVTARGLLPRVQGPVGPGHEDLRAALLRFIGDFATWDLSADATYLEVSRGLVKAAHPEDTPLVVDPFAGGGSIPLEAMRLGCDAFASDLNPVACLILKVMLEDIPRYGPSLADELRLAGAEVKAAAERELGQFYPADPDGARPIAYLWARTVTCDDCGAEIPLVRSWWLVKKARRKRALRYRVVRPKGEPPRVELEIFEPRKDTDVPEGTVSRAKARCLCCPSVLAPERVRSQLAAHRGGADVVFAKSGQRAGGALLLAVVSLKAGEEGRRYRLATSRDYAAMRSAVDQLRRVATEALANGLNPVPDEPLPPVGTLGFRVQRYGMQKWGDLFTVRQKIALVTIARLVHVVAREPHLLRLLALTVGRVSDQGSSLVRWLQTIEAVASTFGRQALPIVWDFCESCPMGEEGANFAAAIEWIAKVVEKTPPMLHAGQVQQADARSCSLPNETAAVWFTDPPYYDAIPYADLSDYFYVWLKRSLQRTLPFGDPSDPANPLTPKDQEAVQDHSRTVDGIPKDRHFFEQTVADAFSEGRRILRSDGVGSVVFAHKTTEGWEALLGGLIRGGWLVTASWPLVTERGARVRARESAALATSVHLVSRPRVGSEIGEWSVVRRELPKRVAEWMLRLQAEGVRGADLVFACIGPALEIYSRYSRVVDADDREIPLGGDPEASEPHRRGYLAYVWEVVGRAALEQVLGQAEAGALEEDARLTALFLWTLQSTDDEGNGKDGGADEAVDDDDEGGDAIQRKKGLALPYDVARRFAQPLGIHLDRWDGRVIESDKGIVRLLPLAERAEQLFGEEGAHAVARELERSPSGRAQMTLFRDAEEPTPRARRGKGKSTRAGDESLAGRPEATTLDRVHAAMLLQRAGKTQALRRLLEDEQERGPDFLRLANALSALYPEGSEEERLLDAMLLATPRV